MRTFLLAIVIATGGLMITNPSRSEYLDWVQHQSQADAFGAVIMTLARPFFDASTRADNLVVATVYTTVIDATHSVRTIGFMHQFISVPVPDEPWHPGAPSTLHPHVIAAQTVDRWQPEAGYRWVSEPPPPGDFRVKWIPGIMEASHPHVVTASTERRWLPVDGYNWIVRLPQPGDLRVGWVPGQASTIHEHVVAANQEGRWLPERGFEWVENPPPPGDFRVKQMADNEDAALPRLQGVTLRRCTNEDHFRPETPCWFSSENGIYVASKLGNMRSSTFSHWPNVDGELANLNQPRPPQRVISNQQLGAMLAKCSAEADAQGLLTEQGFADARRTFRRECMSRMGVEPRAQ